jgi:hypothetical protein
MVKYYGEVQGKRRGEYRTAELGAWFAKDEFLEKWGSDPTIDSPAKDMDAYLSRAGRFVDVEGECTRERSSGLQVYHLGGATVAVKYMFYHDFSGHTTAGNVSVKVASNDPLDDVVGRLRQRFPYLKENASVDDLPDPCEGNSPW